MGKKILQYWIILAVCTFTFQVSLSLFQPIRANAQEATPPTKPNIILINVDNMGVGDWCANPMFHLQPSDPNYDPNYKPNPYLCPEGASSKTPNLDTLTQNGISFTNFHASTPSCSPSRASLLTGRHAHRHGVTNKSLELDRSEITLAKQLKAIGYETAAIGKWHLGGTQETLQNDFGFDEFYITPFGVFPGIHGLCFVGREFDSTRTEYIPSLNFYEAYPYNHGNAIDPPCRVNGNKSEHISNTESTDWWTHANGRALTEILTEKATEYIKRHKFSTNPFFLYLAFTAPHGPLDIDIQNGKPVFEKAKEACSNSRDMDICIWEKEYATTPLPDTGTEPYHTQAMTLVDTSIGDVIKALTYNNTQTNNMNSNTIVILISDNGPDLGVYFQYDSGNSESSQNIIAENGGLFGGYRHLFEGGTRVPLIARWPAKWATHKTTHQLADMTDIFPTLINAAQGTLPAVAIDGIDLSPVLKSPDTPKLKKIVQYYNFDVQNKYERGGDTHNSRSPYAIQAYVPPLLGFDASLNGYKLFLDFNYSLNSLYNLNLTSDPEFSDKKGDEENLPIVSSLSKLSTNFSNGIANSAHYYFPGSWYNYFFSFHMRDNDNKKMNVSVRFYANNTSDIYEKGYLNFGYDLKNATPTDTDSILSVSNLCSQAKLSPGDCTGSIAIFTDRPAHVALHPYPNTNRDQYAAISPARLKSKHLYPKVSDNVGDDRNYLTIWNPTDKPVAVTIKWFDNSGGTPKSTVETSLLAYQTILFRPSIGYFGYSCLTGICGSFAGYRNASSGFTGSMVVSSSASVAANMKYENGTNAAFYQSVDPASAVNFPMIKDGTIKGINYVNNITIYTDSPSGASYDVYLGNNLAGRRTIATNGKDTFRPSDLNNKLPFEGSIRIVGADGVNIAGLTDTTVNNASSQMAAFDIYRAVPPSNSIIFPMVVDYPSDDSREKTEVWITNSNSGDSSQTVSYTLISRDGTSFPPGQKTMNANSTGVIKPAEVVSPANFEGLVRIDGTAIAGVAYSYHQGASASDVQSINIYEAVSINPTKKIPTNLSFNVTSKDRSVFLDVLDVFDDTTKPHVINGDFPIPLITGFSSSTGEVVNRGSHLEYNPKVCAGSNYTDTFTYYAKTEDGDLLSESGTVVTVTVTNESPVVSISSPAAGTTTDNTPKLIYTASKGTVVVTVDGTVVNKTSGDSLDKLNSGPHTVRVSATETDGDECFSEVQFTVYYSPLTITTATLPWGTAGSAYDWTLSATGGTPPYTWSLGNNTTLPEGLTLSSNGKISGTLGNVVGESNFTVQVADADGNQAIQTLLLKVVATSTTTPYNYIYYLPSIKDAVAGWENYITVKAKDPSAKDPSVMEARIRVYNKQGVLKGKRTYSNTASDKTYAAVAPNASINIRPCWVVSGNDASCVAIDSAESTPTGEGSVVVETNVPAIVSTNTIANSYKGFSINEAAKPRTVHNFPKIFDGPNNYQNYLLIQNIYNTPRNVTVKLFGKTITSPGHGATRTVDIPAFGIYKVRPSDIAGGIDFDGSVKVYSNSATPEDGRGLPIPAMCRYEAGTEALAIYESTVVQSPLFFPVLKDNNNNNGTTIYQNDKFQNYLSVVNPGLDVAAISVILYNKDGVEEGRIADSVPAGGKKSWRPSWIKSGGFIFCDGKVDLKIDPPNLENCGKFEGSAVVLSNVPVVGQTNTIINYNYPLNRYKVDAFDLFESAIPNSVLYFPKAYDNKITAPAGVTTSTHLVDNTVYIQNPDNMLKEILIEQFNADGTPNGDKDVAIQPNATYVYRPKDIVTDGTGAFRGSIKITEKNGQKITGAMKYEIHQTDLSTSNIEAMTIYRSMGQ